MLRCAASQPECNRRPLGGPAALPPALPPWPHSPATLRCAAGAGGIFKSAALEVLCQEKRLMSTGAPPGRAAPATTRLARCSTEMSSRPVRPPSEPPPPPPPPPPPRAAGDITKLALSRCLIRCQGKTPGNTMAAALYTDVNRPHSLFIK